MSTRSQLAKYERKAALQTPETEIDKIKLSYFQEEVTLLAHDEPIELTPSQEEKRKKYEYIWGLLIQYSEAEVLSRVMNQYNVKSNMGRRLIRQSQELLGNVKLMKREVQRTLRIAQREAEIDTIKKAEDIEEHQKQELIHKNRERIEKMLGLDREDTLSMKEVLDRLKLPEIVNFTTDPSSLHE